MEQWSVQNQDCSNLNHGSKAEIKLTAKGFQSIVNGVSCGLSDHMNDLSQHALLVFARLLVHSSIFKTDHCFDPMNPLFLGDTSIFLYKIYTPIFCPIRDTKETNRLKTYIINLILKTVNAHN